MVSPALIILLLCVSILVGNIVWVFISNENFADAMKRTFFIVLGALLAYFVLL